MPVVARGEGVGVLELKSVGEIEAMRQAGQVAAATLAAVGEHVGAGVPVLELAELARTVIVEAGGRPVRPGARTRWAPRPFPGAVAVSVNDAVVHGVAGAGRLREGDVVSVDCGVRWDGWCAQTAVTLPVGRVCEEDGRLVEITEQALADGIAAARPGGRVGDLSHAVGIAGRSAGYGIPAWGGCGVGRDGCEAPFVANDGPPGVGPPLRPGLVLTVEPVFVAGGDESLQVGSDGWTRFSGDGSRAAHAGHTVAITEEGPRVLTAP